MWPEFPIGSYVRIRGTTERLRVLAPRTPKGSYQLTNKRGVTRLINERDLELVTPERAYKEFFGEG